MMTMKSCYSLTYTSSSFSHKFVTLQKANEEMSLWQYKIYSPYSSTDNFCFSEDKVSSKLAERFQAQSFGFSFLFFP